MKIARPLIVRPLIAALCIALSITACGGSSDDNDGATPAAVDPTADVISSVAADESIAATLPADVRTAGRIKVATAAKGSPPIRYYTEDRQLIGVEIDLQKAVGKVLNVRMESEDATFDTIIPSLGSGRYDVGQGNFGVTEARKKLVDYVTYYDDGFGFLVKAGSKQKPIDDLGDLCGLRLGTNAGTSFQQILQDRAPSCAAQGKAGFDVSVYRGTADSMLALSQNKMDVLVLSAVFLEYAARQQPKKFTYLNKIYTEHIGFILNIGSPLTEPVNRAVRKLMADGTYEKIMAKWGLQSSAIKESLINPPGLT